MEISGYIRELGTEGSSSSEEFNPKGFRVLVLSFFLRFMRVMSLGAGSGLSRRGPRSFAFGG